MISISCIRTVKIVCLWHFLAALSPIATTSNQIHQKDTITITCQHNNTFHPCIVSCYSFHHLYMLASDPNLLSVIPLQHIHSPWWQSFQNKFPTWIHVWSFNSVYHHSFKKRIHTCLNSNLELHLPLFAELCHKIHQCCIFVIWMKECNINV